MYTRNRLIAITASALLLTGTAASASAAATSPAPSTSLVVNARIAGHCSFDRVVIDVKGKLPPTTVTRVKELRYDGSGKKVPLAGSASWRSSSPQPQPTTTRAGTSTKARA